MVMGPWYWICRMARNKPRKSASPVPMGTPGLVNLMTPMVGSMPLLSVITDDLGVLHPGGDCPCGISSPYLEILGRVGVRDIITCAAGAAEFLKGGTAP